MRYANNGWDLRASLLKEKFGPKNDIVRMYIQNCSDLVDYYVINYFPDDYAFLALVDPLRDGYSLGFSYIYLEDLEDKHLYYKSFGKKAKPSSYYIDLVRSYKMF